jgi:plastocyanin
MRTNLIRICSALVALTVVLSLAACGSSSSATSTATKSTAGTFAGPRKLAVSISNYAYKPPTVTVEVGSRITFTNHDATAHTATTSSPAFDTGTLKPGRSGAVTLRRPGTYTYFCQFHAFMHGTVIVK